MKTLILVGIIFSVAAVGLISFVLRVRHHRPHEPGGFRDWVKNPAYRLAKEQEWAARQAVTVPDDITDAEIQAFVQGLFLRDDEDFNQERLKLLGSKAVPHLIEALADSPSVTSKFPEGGHNLDAKSPFERICKLLEHSNGLETVEPLLRFVDHADTDVRKLTALTLSSMGRASAADAVVRLLSDDEDYVRSYAMIGLTRSIESKRSEAEFLDAVFPALVNLLDREDKSINGDAPKLLVKIDQERALPILLSAKYLNTSNRQLQYILSALNSIGHPIPHRQLLPLLDKLAPIATKYPHTYEYAEALIASGRHPDSTTESRLREALSSASDTVREGAAEALQVLHGLSDPWGFVCGRIDEVGWEDLSIPQRHYVAVRVYDGEVRNGGHAQYFVNSSGNDYEWALQGLQTIGATKHAEILTEVMALFTQCGPSTDRDQRHRQLARMSPKQDAQMEQHDQEYYKCDENVGILLTRYAIENASHFTAKE